MVTDFLIRIKNAVMARNKEVGLPVSKKVAAVAAALKKLGFLDKVKKDKVVLAYRHKKPVLLDLKLVSKPGLRVYMSVSDIEKIKGPSVYLVSTPKGILSSKEAIKQRVGGEIIVKLT